MVPSRWIIETVVSPLNASEATEFLEMQRLDAAAGESNDLAVATQIQPRKDRGPLARNLAPLPASTMVSGTGLPEVNSLK